MGVRGATSCAWISWMDCARDGECVCALARSRALCVRVGLNGLRSEGG